jgi:plastocyanin
MLAAAGVLAPVPTPARATETKTVVAYAFAYAPNPIHIAQGTALELRVLDPQAGEGHTVTELARPGEERFDSPVTPLGKTGEVIGAADLAPGTYTFHCRVHGFMKGTLIVDPAGATGGRAAATPPGLPAGVGALVDPPAVTPALPAQPEAALADAVVRFAGALGVPPPPDVAGSVARAHLPAPVSGRLAGLLAVMTRCQTQATPARALVARGLFVDEWHLPPVGDPARSTLAATAADLRSCAANLEALGLDTARFLRSHPSPADSGGDADLWPVLRYSGGTAGATYVHDYALLVAHGGHSTFLNNAGGNLLDVKRGPPGSAAVEKAPARGCHFANELPAECIPATALLIEAGGDNTYGAKEAPDPGDDGFCTADPVVRRIFTGGAALAGVGILLDSGGHGRFLAKSQALGTGHAAGVGILRSEGGHNIYSAVRNAEGYALTGGFGLQRDLAGGNTYTWYMPGPLDPDAPYQRVGSGGVVSDTGVCDRYPRDVQGVGEEAGSIGLLIVDGADNRYVGTPLLTHKTLDFTLHHGSQAFGGDGGFGALVNHHQGGHNTYENAPGRAENTRINPSSDNTGYFEDSGA